jgi:hypothetical protein
MNKLDFVLNNTSAMEPQELRIRGPGSNRFYAYVYRNGIVNTGTSFMVVKIRFGRGPVVSRRSGKNSRIARLASSLLTLVALGGASLGFWRVSTDLGWAGDFVVSSGIMSHWQIWIGAAAAIQYAAWRLLRYANTAVTAEPASLVADATPVPMPILSPVLSPSSANRQSR